MDGYMDKQLWNTDLERELETVTSAVRNCSSRGLGAGETNGASHVAQLDALSLDHELTSLLRSQSDEIFKHLPEDQRNWLGRVQPEISAFMRLLLWVYSHRVNEPSPGDALLNLRYRNEAVYNAPHKIRLLRLPGDNPTRLQRLLHGFGTVLVPWIWERTREVSLVNHWSGLPEQDWRQVLSKGMDKAEKVFTVATLLNYLMFFYNGKYRSLLDRILRMRVVYGKAEAHRPVSFEFINQQLLYDGFSDMLICLLPLIDWDGLRRLLSRTTKRVFVFYLAYMRPILMKIYKFAKRKAKRYKKKYLKAKNKQAIGEGVEEEEEAAESSDESSDDEEDDEEQDNENQTQSNVNVDDKNGITCVQCDLSPACMPYQTNCHHVYCYYCLKTLQMQQVGTDKSKTFPCTSCGEKVTSSSRI